MSLITYDYTTEMCDKIIKYSSSGKSLESFCGDNNIPPNVLKEWVGNHPEFRDAYNVALCKRIAYWDSQYINGMIDEDKDTVSMARYQLIDASSKISLNEHKNINLDKPQETNNDILDEARQYLGKI